MTELKPCPFCGGKAQYRKENNGFGVGYHYVGCGCIEGCFARGRTKEQAIEKWNNRPSPWHTDTPTEEGWYIIKVPVYDGYLTNYLEADGKWRIAITYNFYVWQKIKPYKEKKK